MILKTVFLFEWKKVKASPFFFVAAGCLSAIVLYALYSGHAMMNQQQRYIKMAVAREDSIFNQIVYQVQHPDTTTAAAKWGYSHLTDAGWTITSPNKRWTSYWEPSPISFLAVGNRDIYPYYHELEPYSFYMRFFKNEISSPFKLLSGNLDLAFVITLLFPLFIIAFTFDVFAAEQESGTYKLLNAVTSADAVIRFKLLFYLTITLLLLNGGLIIALVMVPGMGISSWLTYVGLANAYLFVWFGGIFLITLLKASPVNNALMLVSVWIFLAVAYPAMCNAIADAKYPVQTEQLGQYIRRVQMSDNARVKKALMNRFYHYYPQYAKTDTTQPSYFNKMYVAFGNLNDREADPLLDAYIKTMRRRENFLLNCNFFNPVTCCQHAFTDLAGTDLDSYIRYVRQARGYVQALKEDLTQKCFDDVPLTTRELKHRLSFSTYSQTHTY